MKIFEDLKREVIDQGRCNFCGACLAVCTANDVNALCVRENIPQYIEDPEIVKKCLECGICYLVCGQTEDLEGAIGERYGTDFPLGSYKYLTIAKTTDQKIHVIAQDGGVVTSILKYLFQHHLIDGAVVNKPNANWKSTPEIIISVDELFETVGTRYNAIPAVQELGNYRLIENKENPRLAFVGTPCQIQPIRKMQVMNAKPGVFVKYAIGLFCMENFDYEGLMREKLAGELRINLADISKLNIKKNFFVHTKDGQQIEIPLKDLQHLVRKNCHYCIDFTNICADISVGGIGAPAGYSTVLVRTDVGQKLFSKLLVDKALEEINVESREVGRIRAEVLSQVKRLGQLKLDKGREAREERG